MYSIFYYKNLYEDEEKKIKKSKSFGVVTQITTS